MIYPGCNIKWWIKITHEPSGESVSLDSRYHRSQHKAVDVAKSVIKSRLYDQCVGITKSEEVVATYEFPDNDPYPNDITEYKK